MNMSHAACKISISTTDRKQVTGTEAHGTLCDGIYLACGKKVSNCELSTTKEEIRYAECPCFIEQSVHMPAGTTCQADFPAATRWTPWSSFDTFTLQSTIVVTHFGRVVLVTLSLALTSIA